MAGVRDEKTQPMIDVESFMGRLDSAAISRFSVVIPDDQLKAKRLRNLTIAIQVIVALNDGVPVGLVYVRKIGGIPNVTWLVAESARRRGLALRLLARLQQDRTFLTAICRNEASVALARRAGFSMFGPLGVWWRSPVMSY
jgi:RimJ/RimL family protein N-acetyltransferase